MSIKKKISLLMILSLLMTPLTAFAVSQEQEKVITIPYEYEMYANEWKSSKIRAERVAICQIPQNILTNLSTDALIETVLDYPFFIDIYAHNSIQQGFESIKNEFNGFKELFNRKDIGIKLLKKYQNIDISEFARSRQSIYYLSNIEVLLAQKEIQDTLNTEKLQILTNETQKKYNEKANNVNYYGSTFSIFYRLLSEQQETDLFANTTTVRTPNGSSVSVMIRGEIFSQAQKNESANMIKNSYPNVVMLRSATSNYNCHSYAWYSTSSTNKYWMNDPSKYWKDGSYTSVDVQNSDENDKVFYSNGDHSAIVTYRVYGPISTTYAGLEFTSKWGDHGLYKHSPMDSPYESSNLKFYR